MDEQESLQAAIHEDVQLHAYDASWPEAFLLERKRLLSLFPGRFIDIQHIGSTAITGMSAKPIIDILAGVASMAVAEALAEPLCLAGYTTSAEFNAALTDRKWLSMVRRPGQSDCGFAMCCARSLHSLPAMRRSRSNWQHGTAVTGRPTLMRKKRLFNLSLPEDYHP